MFPTLLLSLTFTDCIMSCQHLEFTASASATLHEVLCIGMAAIIIPTAHIGWQRSSISGIVEAAGAKGSVGHCVFFFFFFFEFNFIVLSCRPSDLLQEIRYMHEKVFIVGKREKGLRYRRW